MEEKHQQARLTKGSSDDSSDDSSSGSSSMEEGDEEEDGGLETIDFESTLEGEGEGARSASHLNSTLLKMYANGPR